MKPAYIPVSRPHLIVDCAGTLTDLGSVIPERAFGTAFLRVLGKCPSPDMIRAPMGREKREHILCLLEDMGLGNASGSLVDAIYTTLEAELLELAPRPTEIPGVPEAVRAYRRTGRGVVLTTGYSRKVAERVVSGVEWLGECLTGWVSSSDVEHKRPAPDMIHRAMRILGVVDRPEVIKIDDTAVGVEAADNAGVASVLVLSGTIESTRAAARVNARLDRKRLVARDLAEVIGWIERGELVDRIRRRNATRAPLAETLLG